MQACKYRLERAPCVHAIRTPGTVILVRLIKLLSSVRRVSENIGAEVLLLCQIGQTRDGLQLRAVL